MTYQEWLGFMQQYLQSVEKYSSIYSGQQIDTAIGKALNPDTTPTANSTAIITSGGVKSALTGVGDNTGVRLSSGDDLNTIIKTGFYSWYGGSASTRPSNLPSLDGVTQNYCSMIVSPMSASSVMQMIFTHGTYKKIARRFLDRSTWGDWEELVTKSALDRLRLQYYSATVDLSGLTWTARTGCWTATKTLSSLFGATDVAVITVNGYGGIPVYVFIDGNNACFTQWASGTPTGTITIRGWRTPIEAY